VIIKLESLWLSLTVYWKSNIASCLLILRYISVMMLQAELFWDQLNYESAERVLKRASEYCADYQSWQINYGHILYMQEKFNEASKFYELVLKRNKEKVQVYSVLYILSFLMFQQLYLRIYQFVI
jgi:tetratricopeptide (TPR) repeat protein